MKIGYIGIDQYGHKYTINKFPRKELVEQTGVSNVAKMYRDKKEDNTPRHVGYIIGGLWIEVFEVHTWND